MKKFAFSVPKVDDPNSYLNLAKFSFNPKDNSLYASTDFFGQTGLHLSMHGSGKTHLRSSKPPYTNKIDTNFLLMDIQNKSKNFNNNFTSYDKDPGDILILKTDNLIKDILKFAKIKEKRAIINLEDLGKLVSIKYDSKNKQEALLKLKEEHKIKNNDLIITGNDNSISFGTIFSAIYINPYDKKSYEILPGFIPMVDPMKNFYKQLKDSASIENPLITNLNAICKKIDSDMTII